MTAILNLKRFVDAKIEDHGKKRGLAVACEALGSLIKEGKVPYSAFSLAEMAQTFCGLEWYHKLNPANHVGLGFHEAGEDGVDVTAFANLTGALLSSRVWDAFNHPSFVGESLVEVIPTRQDGEKMGGVENITEEADDDIRPGMPYPYAGFGEDYIQTPATTKRGQIVAITKEAIFFDQTGRVMGQASKVGEMVGWRREVEILDVVLGAVNNHNWKGTAYNTYIDAGAWDNVAGSNGIVDWTDIEQAMLLLTAMTDPANGMPIVMNPNTIITHSAKKMTALRIVNATEIQFGDGASSTTAAKSANPLAGENLRVVSSPYIDLRFTAGSITNTSWYFGDPKTAFAYMQNWPLTISQAPPQSEDEFNKDIVLKVKASERGKAASIQPRAMVKSNA